MENTFGMNIIPENDQQRTEALKRYKILYSPPEHSFDNAAKLATQIFGVPIALISFVAPEDVFLKATIGMGAQKSIPRGISLSSLAILDPDVTVFEDTLSTPHLLSNPMVTGELAIRFYAGAPIITCDGYTIGTVSLMDKMPRKFTAQDREILKGLAKVVMDETELRLAAINEELAKTHDNLQHLLHRLAQSESRFREMIEQAPVAMLVLRGEGMVFEIVNPYMLRLLDRGPEIIGTPLLRGMPEMAGQPVFDILYQVYRTGKPHYGFESPIMITRNGKTETGYFNYAYTPLLENGKISGVLEVITEVTEQIKIREELKKAEEMLRFSIEAANVGTWFIDIQNLEFKPSSSLKRLFGYLPDEKMSYDEILNLVTPDYRSKIIDAVNATFTNGKSFDLEFSVTGLHDQKLRWIKAIGKIDNDIEGKLIHFSGVAIEVTEQKQDDIRKNDFIAMVSHELKTPLTSLKGYMQLLIAKNRKNEDGFTFNALEKGNLQVNKMTSLINGFLNVSQLEAGKIYLDKQNFQLNFLMEDIVEEISMTTQNHHIVMVACPPVTVYADQEKIGQVINNFLSNAVKYSPRDTKIELKCQEIDGWVKVSVKDEGMGIDEQDISKLFDRFYRVHNSSSLNIAGFGIGLYLCAEIIQRHEGKIGVQSEPGKGSTFYFSLPVITPINVKKVINMNL